MSILKILVVEYITGGGFNKDELPDHLANEGLMMLEALVNSLQKIDGIELICLIDERLIERLSIKLNGANIIGTDHSFKQAFTKLLEICDAVWPIAPECDAILQGLCETVEQSGKILLNPRASAVAIAGNKWLTYLHLSQHRVKCVETSLLQGFVYSSGELIIKPVDGVGCEDSYIVRNKAQFDNTVIGLHQGNYVVQPHLEGDKTSLSALFKNGQGWLICVNRQHFDIVDHRYRLMGITVNVTPDVTYYRALLDAIAQALPGLWGYAGIDLIETQDGLFVLEINPRLTSSYVGIDKACHINCAQLVLDLLNGNPRSYPKNNNPFYLDLQH